MLEPIKKGDYKNPHLANFNKRYLGDNDENTEMPDIKYITSINNFFISECTTFIQFKSSIQSTWSRFKFIQFNNGQENQTSRLVKDKNTIAYI